jgi:hypothetical protein
MSLLIPPGFAAVSLQITNSALAREAFITFGVDVSAAAGDFEGAAADVFAGFATAIDDKMDNACTLGPTTLRVGQDGTETLVVVDPQTTSGTVIQSSAPPNCALLVTKRSTRGGRRGKGRMYIPWALDEASIDEAGKVTTSVLNAWNVVLAAARLALTTNGVPMVILHSTSEPGTEHPTTPGSPNVVTSLVADSIIGTQRRRLGR